MYISFMKPTSNLEVYLGNWGTVSCLNTQHRDYLIEAKNHKDIYQAILSWHGNWITPAMKQEYDLALVESKFKCDALWNAIPDTDDLRKNH